MRDLMINYDMSLLKLKEDNELFIIASDLFFKRQ